MALRLIDTKVTDKNGVVALPVTGKGNGLMTFKATSDNLTSTVELLDCMWYDNGDNDTGYPLRLNRESDGETVTLSSTGDNAFWIFKGNGRYFDAPFIIEFDLTYRELNNGVGGTCVDLEHNGYTGRCWFTSTGHYRIKVSSSEVVALTGSQSISYLPVSSQQYPSDTVRVSFRLSNNKNIIKYEDFKLYRSD